MKRYYLAIALANVLAVLGAVVPPYGSAAAQEKVLKFATIQATGQPSYKGMEKMAELVAQRTNGALKLQLFADGQLGTEQESTEGVQFGTIDLYMGSSGAVGRFLPSLEAFAAPYLWRDVDHMMKVVRGPIGEEINKEMIAKTGIRLLDMGWFFGARHLATKGFEIKVPADLKGRKIRMQPTTIYIETMRAMGANVISMDFKEVYTGLQTGVIEGLDNPANVYSARAFWEVINNLNLTGHILQNQVVIINEQLFKSLKPEWQKVLVQAAIEAGDYQTELTLKNDAAAIDQLKQHKVKIVQPDTAAFRAATANVHKQFEGKWAKGFYERIRDTR
jgi:tripartite ATP-independent transporter DctP family solute receptor